MTPGERVHSVMREDNKTKEITNTISYFDNAFAIIHRNAMNQIYGHVARFYIEKRIAPMSEIFPKESVI